MSEDLATLASGTYSVTVTDANGCTTTSSATLVSINALPTVTVTSIPSSGAVCTGASITLSGVGATSYVWDNGITNSTSFVPSSTITYTVTGTDANGCVNTSSQLVTVNSLPTSPVANSISLDYNGLQQSTSDLIPASGQSISWFTASTGGLSSTKPQGTNVGTYNSYANAIINATGCISSTRTLVFLTINKKPITITVDAGQTKEYGAANPTTYTYGVSPTLATGLSPLNGTLTRAAGETVAPWAIEQNDLTTANNPNYTINYVGNNFTITKKSITITVDAGQTKIYGAANPATYTYGVSPSLTGLAALNGTLTRIAGETVGPWAIEQNDLTTANNANYTINYVGNDFTITQKPLTITATAGQTKVYGTADPSSFPFTLSAPLLFGDVLTGALSRVPGEPAGTYAIQQGTLTNANYDITYVGSNFVITTAPLSITGITGANKIYDGTTIATINGTASYVGLVAADAGLAIAGTPVFNFNNKNVFASKPITVTGFTAPSANYTLTQPTGLTGDITPKTAIINIVASNKQYDGTTTATVTLSSSSFISPDIVTINYTSATFDTKEVNNGKTVTVTGINLTGADAPNYVVASTTATALADITGTSIPFAVPNAFSPNGDGINDKFKIIFNNTTGVTLRMQIFNRNGILMFSTTNISAEWDGRSLKGVMQDMGIYFVKYRIEIAGGITYEDTPRIYLLK